MSVSGTISADGDSLSLAPNSPDRDSSGVFVHCSGTFGGGTATIYFKADDDTWKAVSNGAFTGAFDKQVMVPNEVPIKITVSGSTTPSIFYQISNMSRA